MPTLSPQPQFDVRPEAPVVSPSALETTANVVGALGTLVSATGRQNTGTGGKNIDQALLNGLNKVQALRDEGRDSEANQMARRIGINYRVEGGDFSKPGTQEMVEQYTGLPGEFFGFTMEEVAVNSVLESDEFKTAYTSTKATDPDLTEEERTRKAMAIVAQTEANKAIMEQAEFNWSNTTEAAFSDMVGAKHSSILGQLAIASESGEKITRENLQTTRAELSRFNVQIQEMRPSNISDEQWKPVQDRLTRMDEHLTFLEGLEDPENIGSNAMSKVLNSMQELPDSTEKNLVIKLLSDDPSTWATMGVLEQSTITKMMKATIDQEQAQAYASDLSLPKLSEEQSSYSAEETYDSAVSAMRVSNLVTPEAITSTLANRTNWAKATNKSLAFNLKMASEGGWVDAPELQKQFGPRFFNNMEALRTSDPKMYKQMYENTQRVLSTLGETLDERRMSVMEGTALEYNPSTNTFRVTEEGARARLGAGIVFNELDEAVKNLYGGDYDAAFSDNGSRFETQDNRDAWAALTGDLYGGKGDMTKQVTNAISFVFNAQQKLTPPGEDQPASEDQRGSSSMPVKYKGNAIDMLKSFEGFRPEPYWDENAWRIGYGSDTITLRDGTVQKVVPGMQVTTADARRDLNRRTQEFSTAARRKVGRETWSSLPKHVTEVMTSIAYNYGSIPDRLMPSLKSGDVEQIAQAVESLGNDNGGINRTRRMKEAAIIRGGDPNLVTGNAPQYYGGNPVLRPEAIEGKDEALLDDVRRALDPVTGVETPKAPEIEVKQLDPLPKEDKTKASKKTVSEEDKKAIKSLVEAGGSDVLEEIKALLATLEDK